MKQIKTWLKQLPDGYRERALANTPEDIMKYLEPDFSNALYSAFVWRSSPEKRIFWAAVIKHYYKGTDLPELPK